MARGKTTTDHDEIRRWAEERSGQPATVKGTERGGEEAGMIRIDFPGYSGEGKLEPISWDEWFQKFDEKNLALVYQDKTSGGKESFFNKLVSRDFTQSAGERTGRSRRAATTRGKGRSARTSKSRRTSRRSAGSAKAKGRGGSSARGRGTPKRSGRTSAKGRSSATNRASTGRKSSRSRSSSRSSRGPSKKK